MRWLVILPGLVGVLLVSACGGGDSGGNADPERDSAFERSIRAAQRVSTADFPPGGGRTLQEVADRVEAVQAGLATQEFTPGRNRLAFGVIGRDNKLVYGPSAVYFARTPNEPAEGPFPAPADPLVVDPPFRSKQAALESDAVAAIYETELPLPRPGPLRGARRDQGSRWPARRRRDRDRSQARQCDPGGRRAPAARGHGHRRLLGRRHRVDRHPRTGRRHARGELRRRPG